MKRPNRFRWTYAAPSELVIVADGEKLWIYDVELKEVTVTPFDDTVGASPAVLLSGDRNVRVHKYICAGTLEEKIDALIESKQALAELFRELTRSASLLQRLGAGPAGQEVTYASAHELLVAYQVDREKRLIQVLSLVWLGPG